MLRFRPAVLIAVALLAVGASMMPSPLSAVAASPVALGANTSDAPGRDGAKIDEFAARAGRQPAIVMWFQSWSEPLFYSSQMPAVDSRGAVPMVTWEPSGVSLRDIAAGSRDAYVTQAARDARGWGKPFFLRFAHEMNGDWYSWGQGTGGNTPADYVAAWRRVVSVFRAEGATNVKWVWAPNTIGHGVGRFESQYPGDGWVDWVGLDGYNWGTNRGSGWRSLSDVFGPSYDALTALTQKPLMIAETAAPEQGGDKAAWIESALTVELPARMPQVRALVWFDRLKEADWRIDSSPAARSAFRAAALEPALGLDRQGLLNADPAPVPAPPAPPVSPPASGSPVPVAPLGGSPVLPVVVPVAAPGATPARPRRGRSLRARRHPARPGRMTISPVRASHVSGGLRIGLHLRGTRCSGCRATLVVRSAGRTRWVGMRRVGRRFVTRALRLSGRRLQVRVVVKNRFGGVVARSTQRSVDLH